MFKGFRRLRIFPFLAAKSRAVRFHPHSFSMSRTDLCFVVGASHVWMCEMLRRIDLDSSPVLWKLPRIILASCIAELAFISCLSRTQSGGKEKHSPSGKRCSVCGCCCSRSFTTGVEHPLTQSEKDLFCSPLTCRCHR